MIFILTHIKLIFYFVLHPPHKNIYDIFLLSCLFIVLWYALSLLCVICQTEDLIPYFLLHFIGKNNNGKYLQSTYYVSGPPISSTCINLLNINSNLGDIHDYHPILWIGRWSTQVLNNLSNVSKWYEGRLPKPRNYLLEGGPLVEQTSPTG